MVKHMIVGLIIITVIFTLNSITTVDAIQNYEVITAHRGSSTVAPENTVSSVLRAIDDRAGFAEIDVQMSSDGIAVLFHDPTLAKLGMSQSVDQLTYDEIAKIDAGQWFDSTYTGEQIPTLEEVLKVAKNKIKLNIELKVYDTNSLLPEIVVRLIESNDFINECIITSFDLNAIELVKKINPHIKTGWIVRSLNKVNGNFYRSDIDVLSVKSSMVNHRLMRNAARFNKKVFVWTVNDQREMNRMLNAGVHSIITDYPHKLYALINNK